MLLQYRTVPGHSHLQSLIACSKEMRRGGGRLERSGHKRYFFMFVCSFSLRPKSHMQTNTHTHTCVHTHTHTHAHTNMQLPYPQSRMCKQCGSIVSPMLDKPPPSESALSHVQPQWKCRMCEDGGLIEVISVPYVFRYLVAELAAMNIRVKLESS